MPPSLLHPPLKELPEQLGSLKRLWGTVLGSMESRSNSGWRREKSGARYRIVLEAIHESVDLFDFGNCIFVKLGQVGWLPFCFYVFYFLL